MGLICKLKGHDWQNGKCRRCGEAHQEHQWEMTLSNDCIVTTCSVCGATMQLSHKWEKVPGQYKEKCAYCGKIRSVAPPAPPAPDVSKITDPEKLKKIALDYACDWIGTGDDFETACKNIADQMLLAEIFSRIEHPHETEAKFIAALITEPEAVKAASKKSHYSRLLSDKLDELRILKLREKSPSALAEIAKSDISLRVRVAAANLLKTMSGQTEEAAPPIVSAARTPKIPKDKSELIKKAERYIAKSNVSVPICNIEGLTAQLVEFFEPSEESLRENAEKMVRMKLPENNPQFSRLVEDLIAFWKEQPADEPKLFFYSDDNDEICGTVSNGANLFFKKPDDWNVRIEAAKRAK